jgi:RNA polymerase sigma-70 factor (ECF subfamily)
VNDANRQRQIAPVGASIDADEYAAEQESPSVESQAMSEREFERLCVAIARLPERTRQAFVLRKVYGYSCREIAEHLGRSTNTVREQVAQGFRKLRALEISDLPRPNGRAKDEVKQSATEPSDQSPVLDVPRANHESSG